MTDRERAIIRYIAEHPGTKLRSIGRAVKIASNSNVTYHLRRLRAQGLIAYEDHRQGTLRLATGVFVNSEGEIYKLVEPYDLCPVCGHPKQNHGDGMYHVGDYEAGLPCVFNWEPVTRETIDWEKWMGIGGWDETITIRHEVGNLITATGEDVVLRPGEIFDVRSGKILDE